MIEISIGNGRSFFAVSLPIRTTTLFLSRMSMNCLAPAASQAGLIKTTRSDGQYDTSSGRSVLKIAPSSALQIAFSRMRPPNEWR